VSVVSCADQQPIGVVLTEDRRDDLVPGHPVGVAGCSCRHRDIDRGPDAGPLADFFGPPFVRIEGKLVGADVKDPRIPIEHRLGSVAVVDVPIDHRYPCSPGGQEAGGHSNVVEYTEPHRPVGRGVMTGRPEGKEADLQILGSLDLFDSSRTGSCRPQCGFPARRHHDCVGIEVSTAGPTEPLHSIEIGREVNEFEHLSGRRGWDQFPDWKVGVLNTMLHRPQAGDALRMMRAGLMLAKTRMGHIKDRCITRGQHVRTLPQVPLRGRIDRLRIRGAWPGRVEITAGFGKALVRPWNDDINAASLRLERGSARFLASCARVVTDWSPEILSPATLPSMSGLWKEAGFIEIDRLLLMEHDLNAVDPPAAPIETGSAEPLEELNEIDSEAFVDRWRLGRLGLEESVTATSRSVVLRVADGGECVGFAIVGVALGGGYLQRLAVLPDRRGRGFGADLVRASLRWARGNGAHSMLVNTQTDNEKASSLYRRLGFQDVPGGLLLFRYSPQEPPQAESPLAETDN